MLLRPHGKNFLRAKRRGVGDKKPACIEEEQRFKKAKRRLEEIEELINSIPRWKNKTES